MEKGFGREAVQFTVKGPIPIKGDDDLNLSGVKAIDITLAQSSTIGELVFKNYYCATVAVLVLYDTKGKSRSGRGSWSCSVAQKVLMPNPHLEPGSHDTFSITPSDSLVSWNDVSKMRLILRQPSPLWLTFKIEEVNLYSDLPRMGGTEGCRAEEMDPERMLLSLLRRQTQAALSWSLRPDSNPSAGSPASNNPPVVETDLNEFSDDSLEPIPIPNLSDITCSSTETDEEESKFIRFCLPTSCCLDLGPAMIRVLTQLGSEGEGRAEGGWSTSRLLRRHPELQPKHRSLILDWMMEISGFYLFSRETYHQAVSYLDRYLLVSKGLSKEELHLAGVSCFQLANKLEEVKPLPLPDLVSFIEDAFSPEDIIRGERTILEALDFRTTLWTLNKWLFTLVHFAEYELALFEYVQLTSLLDLVTLDTDSLRFSRPVLASACLSLVTSVQATIPPDCASTQFEVCQCMFFIQKYWDAIRVRPMPEGRRILLAQVSNKCKLVKFSSRQFYDQLIKLYWRVNDEKLDFL